MKDFNPLLDETFVFRPFEGMEKGGRGSIAVNVSSHPHPTGLLRYANGNWIPDDGEPDLAFVQGVFAYGVDLPYYTNILWSWRDLETAHQHLPDDLKRKVYGWHHMTIGNKPHYDFHWDERNQHPNEIAYRSAMHKCSSIHGVANGRSIRIDQDSEWIKRGLLYVKSTMARVVPPDNPVCFLCLDNGKGHLLEALESRQSELEGKIEYYQDSLEKAERDIANYEYDIEKAKKLLGQVNAEITGLGSSLPV